MKIRLYIEICTACNLRCEYCFEKEYKPTYIPTEQLLVFYKKIINDVAEVVITGGEPTLHPEFNKIVRFIAQHTPVIVTTNGTNYSAKELKELLRDFQNVQVQFSLDAYNKKYVDSLCGFGTFDKVITTINQLSDYSSRISISSTLINQPINEIKKLYKFVRKRKINCYFPNILPYGALLKNWEGLMPPLESYIALEDSLFGLLGRDNENRINSNKANTILNRCLSDENYNDSIVIKLDASGHLLTCPATDFSYECSRICNMEDIKNGNELKDILSNYSSCCSAHMIDEECNCCPVEKYCQRVFCGNCIHMVLNNKEVIHYICETYRYHYINLCEACKNLGVITK